MPHADVFISYSRKDQKWKDHVLTFMQVMQEAGQFNYEAWHDSKIDLGKNWEDEKLLVERVESVISADIARFAQAEYKGKEKR